MSKITKTELNELNATKTSEEWNKLCDKIKAAHNGAYPEDWWAVVMTSGVAAKARARWNCNCGKAH